MEIKNKVFCHFDLLRFIPEESLTHDGENLTISLIDDYSGVNYELMIFLEKDVTNSCFEVRVYKSDPAIKYIPHEYDKVKRYEDNDEYATFFFL